LIQGLYKAKTITPRKQAPTNGSKPEPMQIHSSSFKKLLPKGERPTTQRRLMFVMWRRKSPSSRLPYKSFNLKTTQSSKCFNE
jgi:hypothetical protein